MSNQGLAYYPNNNKHLLQPQHDHQASLSRLIVSERGWQNISNSNNRTRTLENNKKLNQSTKSSQPKVKVKKQNSFGNGYNLNKSWLEVSSQPLRYYKEDRVSIIVNVSNPLTQSRSTVWPNCSYLAAYDDHGGSQCKIFKRQSSFIRDQGKSSNKSIGGNLKGNKLGRTIFCNQLQKQSLGPLKAQSEQYQLKMYYESNVGDCRAIQSQDGRKQDLTRDKKKDDDIERARIIQTGGKIYEQGQVIYIRLIKIVNITTRQIQQDAIKHNNQFSADIEYFPFYYLLSRSFGVIEKVPSEDEIIHSIKLQDEGQLSNEEVIINDSRQIELPSIQKVDNQKARSEYALEITNLSVRYREKLSYVLKDINLKIQKLEKVWIIGRTGSGKTTILQAITRLIGFYKGSIKIFGNDYNEVSIEETRKESKSTITSQEVDGLISEIIDQEIPFLRCLNSKVDEFGKNYSQGQRQLIVLLRVMLQRKKIIILDECTSSMDEKYSNIINKMLTQYLKDKTVINVTHKLEAIKLTDTVFLIEQGQVSKTGNKNEVLTYLKEQ